MNRHGKRGIPAGGMIARFLHWWLGELKALVPGRLRRLAGGGRFLMILVEGEDARAVLCQGPETRELARWPLAGPAPEALAERRLHNLRVHVRLDPSRVLRHRLALPAAAAENLRQVLAFEMDRHTPFKADQVEYDARVAGHSGDGEKVLVDLAVAPHEYVAEVTAAVEDSGFHPATVGVPDDAAAEPDAGPACRRNAFDMSPEARRPRRAAAALWINRALGTLAAGLVLAVLAIPLWYERAAVVELNRTLGQTRQEAQAVSDLRERMEGLRQDLLYVVERKEATVPTVLVLEELSAILPDGVWLDWIRMNGARIEMQGNAGTASELIGIIEDSALFEEPRFTSSINKNPQTGVERFKLVTEVTGNGVDAAR